MLIGEMTVEDIPRTDHIRQATEPWHVATVQNQQIWFTKAPEQAKHLPLCAEADGRLIAVAAGSLELYAGEPGTASIALRVHPDARGQGIGSALHGRLEEHLRAVGASRIQTRPMDDPASIGFAERRGYVLGATGRFIVVDPRVLPPEPPRPAGVTVLSATEAGPEAFYAVIDIASRDEPGDVPFTGMPYDDWLDQYWRGIDYDLSMIAMVDGAPAATTALTSNNETGRAMSAGSDTLREFRGRGLVKLIKTVSLRAAATRGISAAFSANDEVNAPMRAINDWLGYRYVGGVRTALKQL